MSNWPPRRPSLAHLRKQAKQRLRRLRPQQPALTLAEVQHALAREYGFASWPTLKAQVERLAAITFPEPVTFQRYTPAAREAVFFARHEAGHAGSETLEPEHVLLGLIRASQRRDGRLFDPDVVSLDRARRELTGGASPAGRVSLDHRISTGERSRDVFQAAAEEADRLRHRAIGLVHILLSVLRESDSAAARLLGRVGIRGESVRARIAQLLDGE